MNSQLQGKKNFYNSAVLSHRKLSICLLGLKIRCKNKLQKGLQLSTGTLFTRKRYKIQIIIFVEYFRFKSALKRYFDDYFKFCFQSKISRLPAYLTIQFVRFYFKEKESINAKILKDVKFPLNFDAFDLCTRELQIKLTPMREKFQKLEEAQLEESRSAKGKKNKKDVEKKETKTEPFWFQDGKLRLISTFYKSIP